MAILFKCSCGKALKVQDEHAGKKTRCVQCGAIVVVPKTRQAAAEIRSASSQARPRPGLVKKPPAPLEALEVEEAEEERPRAKKPKSKAEPLEVVEEAADDEEMALIDDGDDDKEEERPRKKKKRKKGKSTSQWDFSFESSMSNSGALGGILIMVGAAAWFVVGWMNDRIFFYPPILFVVGLMAFFKGLMGK